MPCYTLIPDFDGDAGRAKSLSHPLSRILNSKCHCAFLINSVFMQCKVVSIRAFWWLDENSSFLRPGTKRGLKHMFFALALRSLQRGLKFLK